MKIHVRSKHLAVDETVRSYVERRLEFSLGRLATRILRATVQIVDLNGPRGGEDKVCRVEVRLRPTGTVFVEERDADLYAALDRGADRAGRSVARALKRERDLERSPASLSNPPMPTNVADTSRSSTSSSDEVTASTERGMSRSMS